MFAQLASNRRSRNSSGFPESSYSAFGGIADMAGLEAAHPVANDLKRKSHLLH
jgi:hypothetical protein